MATIHTPEGTRRWHVVVPHATLLTLEGTALSNVAYPENSNNFLVVVGPVSVQGDVAAGAYTANAATVLVQLLYGSASGPIAANSANFTTAIAANNNFISAGGAFGNPQANIGLITGQALAMQLINGGSELTGGNANNQIVVEFQTIEMDGSFSQS